MKIVSKFAFVLRARRKERRMTQRLLGKLVNISSKLISKYENGDRIPSRALRLRLEGVLGRLPNPCRFRPPRHNTAWMDLFKDKRVWRRRRDRSFSSRLNAARLSYESQLDALRSVIDAHPVWCEAADTGSGLELVVCLRVLGDESAVELQVRPISWGFRKLAVCDPVTGEILADKSFPAIGLSWNGCRAVLIPQVSVLTPSRPIVLDFLVSLRVGRRVIWFALEIDGPGHCSKADELRAVHLEVTRIAEAEVLSQNFLALLKERLLAMLPEASAEVSMAA